MITVAEMKEILSNIKYNEEGWEIVLRMDENRPYLQIRCDTGVCNVTGEAFPWSGRKWFLSPHMCRSEIIRTAHKAVEAAVLHEMNEKFTYKGEMIFDPHIDLDAMVSFRKTVPLDSREHDAFAIEKAKKPPVNEHVAKNEEIKKSIIDNKTRYFYEFLMRLMTTKTHGRGALRRGDCFCALGLWYDTVDSTGWKESHFNHKGWSHRLTWDEISYGSYNFAKLFFGRRIVDDIYQMNDSGKTLEEIRDYLYERRDQILKV